MIDKEKLSASFGKKGCVVAFFDTKEDVSNYIDKLIDGKDVGIGGSMTVKELGLYDMLSKHNKVHWHLVDNRREVRMEEIESDVFILSANGVSEQGEIVNIDGTGNRLASSLYGPRTIVYIIGKNKIEPNLERAIWRARNIAAPKNAKRFNLDTPCVKAGATRCFDCNSKERICNGFLVVTRPMNGQDVHILFVDEDLGY